MPVNHVWAGAATASSLWIRGKVTSTESAELRLSRNSDLSEPVSGGARQPGTHGMVSWQLNELEPGTRYYYVIDTDGTENTAFSGTVRTHPVPGEPASFTFAASGDAGLPGEGDDSYVSNDVSDNPVFDTMREQALAEEWLWFSHLGDLHYRNIAVADAAPYRKAYDDLLTFNGQRGAEARQGRFYRSTGFTYCWDDHDFGPNNSNRTAAGNAAANAVYRERVPHYPLPSESGIHHSWTTGRVLFIASDVRSARDPNNDPQSQSKTMLGTAQKSWMEQQLTGSDAVALVWIMPSRWLAPETETGDTWNSFRHERAELIQMLGDTGWLQKTIQLTADKHNLSISSAQNNPHGGFPIFMFASLDANFGVPDPLYDVGSTAGRRQYGTIHVQDDGQYVALEGTGWIRGTAWRSYDVSLQPVAQRQAGS